MINKEIINITEVEDLYSLFTQEHIEYENDWDGNNCFLNTPTNKYVIEVKPFLSQQDVNTLIDRAIDFCFTEDEEYKPARLSLITKIYILQYYTNIDILGISDIEKINEVIYNTPVNNIYLECTYGTQTDDVIDGIIKGVQYRIDKNVNNTAFNKLINMLITPFENPETKGVITKVLNDKVTELINKKSNITKENSDD